MSTNKIRKIIRIIITRFSPIILNTVFFDSFGGQYNDNPKYVSEKLHELDPSIRIVWSVSEHGKEKPPHYAQQVTTGSKEYYRYAFSSQATVDNYTGLRVFGFQNKFGNNLLSKLAKKPGMLSISTWHGTPLKRIGSDYSKKRNRYYCSGTTYAVAGCQYTKEIIEKAYGFFHRVRLYGTPRNDILTYHTDNSALKDKLGLPKDKKIVLFAPTFRDSVELSGLFQLRALDIETLLDTLSKSFGGEFVFVFRVHHRVLESVYSKDSDINLNANVINGNMYDDMAEYLACADVLITDYSGSLFDFALTGRPCFLYSPDREQYINVERGLYIEYDSLPFPEADNTETLLRNIGDFSQSKYQKDLRLFQERIGNIEDGKASERIAKDIIEHITKTGECIK